MIFEVLHDATRLHVQSKHNLMHVKRTGMEMGDCWLVFIRLVAVSLTVVTPIGVYGSAGSKYKTEVYCNPYHYKYYHPQLGGCKQCDMCPLGQEIIPWEESGIEIGPHGALKCPSCRPCQDQTFTKRRAYKCRSCKVCGQIQVTKRECTKTHNTVCGKQRRTIKTTVTMPTVATSTSELHLPTYSEENVYTSPVTVPQTTPSDRRVTGQESFSVVTFIKVVMTMLLVALSIGIGIILVFRVQLKRKLNGRGTVQANVAIANSQSSCLLPNCFRSVSNLHLGCEESHPLTQLPINNHDEMDNGSSPCDVLSNLNQEGDLYEDNGEEAAMDIGDNPLSQSHLHLQMQGMLKQGETTPASSRSALTLVEKMSKEIKMKLTEHLAVDNKFERVGKSLGLSHNKIGIIKNDNKGDCKEQAYQVLTGWEQKFPNGNNGDIYNALEKCGETEIISYIFSS